MASNRPSFLGHVAGVDGFRIDVFDLHLGVVLHARMAQCFVERLVAVGQVDVLADHGHRNGELRVLDLMDQVVPALEVGWRRVQAQLVADQAIETLLVQHARHFVDRVHVPHGDHAPLGHVGEQRNLGALFFGHASVGSAEQGVGLDTDGAQFFGRVLRGLGLELTGRGDPGQVRQVHESRIVGSHAQAQLAHGLQEGQRFDIAHGTADLHDGHIHRIGRADACAALDVVLDFVGDVGDDLHGLAQVVAPALFLQHRLVNLAGGEVVGLLHARFDETLIVAQIKVGFGAVVGDEHLAVLEGRHGARIHVDVRVELDEGDFEAARL